MASLNFRNAALAVGIAATAIAGGYAAPAAAQQATPQAASQPVDAAAKAKADCLKKLDGVASKSVCSAIEAVMLKEQLEESQKRLEVAKARETCLDKLIAFKGENPTGWANLLASRGKDAIKENPCGVVPLLPK